MDLDLITNRLLLRPLTSGDLDLCLVLTTDPVVMKYVHAPETPEMVVDNLPARCLRGGGGCIGVWCIVERASGEKLGSCVLLPMPVDRDDTDWSLLEREEMPPCEIEVGYLLKPSAWGRGVATEACARLLKFAFEETPLQDVIAVTDAGNAASQRVLTKCGLVRDGNRRAYNIEDVPAFRISKAQWSARQGQD